jgi:hypothetical protein
MLMLLFLVFDIAVTCLTHLCNVANKKGITDCYCKHLFLNVIYLYYTWYSELWENRTLRKSELSKHWRNNSVPNFPFLKLFYLTFTIPESVKTEYRTVESGLQVNYIDTYPDNTGRRRCELPCVLINWLCLIR